MAANVSPDGESVVYLSVEPPPGGMKTLVREIGSGTERELSAVLTTPKWSHDGAFVAGSDRAGPTLADRSIWVCSLDDDCQAITPGFWPEWTADDSGLYFYRPGSTPMTFEIWTADRDGRNERRVTEAGPLHPVTPTFDVAPDGRIVWVQNRPGSPDIWSATLE